MFRWRNPQAFTRRTDSEQAETKRATGIEYLDAADPVDDSRGRGAANGSNPSDGKHRLREELEQQDVAERNGESTQAESLSEAIARLKGTKRSSR